MSNTVKCRYKNCIHDNKEIDKSEAIQVNKSYYHKDCYETKEDISKIIDLFTKHINSNVIYNVLVRVINDIIFNKHNESKFLLYGLQYYIAKKIPLNYPQGLYYVIQNKDVINNYNKYKAQQLIKDEKLVLNQTKEVEFEFKPIKTKGFGDILQ